GTDKTGTLTRNQLKVVELVAGLARPGQPVSEDRRVVQRLLEIAVLANGAEATPRRGWTDFTGDPTEVALLARAEDGGINAPNLRAAVRILQDHPFDPAEKRSST